MSAQTQTAPPEHGVVPHRFKYYDLLVSAFVVVLLISNLVAPKITALGPLRLSGAQLLFPITYIFGDIFTEEDAAAHFRRGEAVRAELNAICRDAAVPMHFTGLGSMMSPHFRRGPIRRAYAATSPTEQS